MRALAPLASMLLSAIATNAVSESASEKFLFKETVAIYHMVEDGAVIYVRPDEYDENQGFIKVYEALDQYLAELSTPGNQSFFPSEEQPIIGELMLVGRNSEKKYFLKDGWLGDGENWVPMNGSDYKSLWSFVERRRRHPGSVTSMEQMLAFTAAIREATEPEGAPGASVQSIGSQEARNLSGSIPEKQTSFESETARVGRNATITSSSGTAQADEGAQAKEYSQSAEVAQSPPDSVKAAAEQGSSGQGLVSRNFDGQDHSPTPGATVQEKARTRTWSWALLFMAVALLFLCFWRRR